MRCGTSPCHHDVDHQSTDVKPNARNSGTRSSVLSKCRKRCSARIELQLKVTTPSTSSFPQNIQSCLSHAFLVNDTTCTVLISFSSVYSEICKTSATHVQYWCTYHHSLSVIHITYRCRMTHAVSVAFPHVFHPAELSHLTIAAVVFARCSG